MRGEEIDIEELTLEEQKIVEWLGKDSLRAIKAVPVARIFWICANLLQNASHTLAWWISCSRQWKNEHILPICNTKCSFVVNSAELLADEAQRAGFEVEALHDIKLFKSMQMPAHVRWMITMKH